MPAIEAMVQYPWIFAVCIGVAGLLVGSFLNVVIYRLPVMLQREWEIDAREILDLQDERHVEVFNLASPSSRCPNCSHEIRAWENIPVLSWVGLKGKCSACKRSISIRYPLVEVVTCALSMCVALQFGCGATSVAVLLLLWGCVALFMIDLDHMLLPDSITLPGIWIGLGVGYLGLLTSLENSFVGAAAGYLAFAGPAWIYSKVVGRSAMGGGDYKLMALFGAWLGWQMLPVIFLLSTVSAAIVGISLARLRDKPFAFGPFIIVGGIVTLFFGHALYAWYFHANGIHIGATFFD